jgi:hypothetical protein
MRITLLFGYLESFDDEDWNLVLEKEDARLETEDFIYCCTKLEDV